MIKSMTGFGRSEFHNTMREIVVQVKSVNHRYRDITVKLSRKYAFAEEAIKSIIKGNVSRGKIEVYLSIENLGDEDTSVKLDMSLAKQYYDNIRELQKKFDVTGDISIDLLTNMHDVMKASGDVSNEEEFIADVKDAVERAVENFNAMREQEGNKLAEDIKARKVRLDELLENIEEKAPDVARSYEAKLNDKITELLEGNLEIAKERIALEAAIFADKSNIDEELVRLKSHLSQLLKIIASSDESKGKKLDFLVQEMNREANTIGSKANDITITNNVLEMKSEIEKIREQVQNIE